MTEDLETVPKLDLLRDIHLCGSSNKIVPPQKKNEAKNRLLQIITEKSMLPLYRRLVEKFKWQVDENLIEKMKNENELKLQELEDNIKKAEENEGDNEIREGLLRKAHYLIQIGEKEAAHLALRKTLEKTISTNYKIDIDFAMIRIGFFFEDFDMIRRNMEIAKFDLESGGDWERKNRLKVYEATYLMAIRNFKQAAKLFTESLSTFAANELYDYNQFIYYAIITNIFCLDRVELQEEICESSEVLSVIEQMPFAHKLITSLIECNYSEFFSALAGTTEELKRDQWLSTHVKFFCREMRIRAYAQLLQSYKSVQLKSMAEAFGVTVEFLDKEISRFISSGRLHCKIDKVAGIIETSRSDEKNILYQSFLKEGDVLLNKVQKLSRIINL